MSSEGAQVAYFPCRPAMDGLLLYQRPQFRLFGNIQACVSKINPLPWMTSLKPGYGSPNLVLSVPSCQQLPPFTWIIHPMGWCNKLEGSSQAVNTRRNKGERRGCQEGEGRGEGWLPGEDQGLPSGRLHPTHGDPRAGSQGTKCLDLTLCPLLFLLVPNG